MSAQQTPCSNPTAPASNPPVALNNTKREERIDTISYQFETFYKCIKDLSNQILLYNLHALHYQCTSTPTWHGLAGICATVLRI